MQFSAQPPFFIIKVQKDIQRDNREKDGNFYTHSDHVFMQRETQHGEIVSIGSEAQKLFPEAKEGQTLIFHHFVTGREMEDTGENKNLVYTDEFYNYYSVTVKSHKGEKNMAYGVWDGEKMIPHKQYVFLEIPKIETGITKTETDLFVINNFVESKDELGNKMKELKNSIGELVKTEVSNDLTQEIAKRENEMNKISKKVNKKEYLLYTVAYISEFIKSKFSKPFSKVGMLNIACNTKIFILDTEYIIADTKYLCCCIN